ncbi:AAA family ATPase [Dyella sp. Tek66A03]|uniref:AAA family ATPase n=1 Tax=Dyella sp. Tek66A03 TaxID=3458298 RepID=UPI00403E54AD
MHPVETDSYVLPTNALEAFINVCCAWTNSNVLGALVPGLQRVGKSFAIQYFMDNHRKWLGHSVGVVSVEVLFHKQTSEGVFFGDLLTSMRCPTTKRRPEDRRALFIGRLVESAARSESKKVVIFIDEAQILDGYMFRFLTGVHNELWRLYKIKALWILVGQPELETTVSTYLAEGKRQIVGRFMTDVYVFQPLSTISDFKATLECYDRHLFHPSGGPSFTAHFAPGPCAAGWGIADDSDIIWAGVERARASCGLPTSSGMTMQGFTTLMNHVIRHGLPNLRAGERLTAAMVDQAVIATNCMIFEQQEALLATG